MAHQEPTESARIHAEQLQGIRAIVEEPVAYDYHTEMDTARDLLQRGAVEGLAKILAERQALLAALEKIRAML
jgi:hypothetical protein